jgi:hypothetical protein
MELAELEARIRRAFASCPPPGDDEIAEAGCCTECDELAAALAGRSWESLREHLEAETFDPDPSYLLQPAAFRYFTPAWVLAALRPGPSADAERRLFSPSYALAPGETTIASFIARYRDAFSPRERRAIRAYLRFLLTRETEEAAVARSRIENALALVWPEADAAQE